MESKEKYLVPNTFWEAVIPSAGNVMITRVTDDKVYGKQIYNRGMGGAEAIDMKVTEWDKEGFLVSFKPEESSKEINDDIVDKHIIPPVEGNCTIGTGINSEGKIISVGIVEQKTANYLKMDGEKAQFETGAIRYTKTGKGRYDLIPESVSDIIMYAQDDYRSSSGYMTTTKTGLMLFAYTNDDIASRFINIVINLVNYYYAPGEDVETIDGIIGKKTTYADFETGWAHMMDDLAKHYEAGAEKYGVDNWKKGIPVIGGDRGGSFADSALRHLNQFCMGKIDEPHQISCIWNCVCGLWTLQEEERKKK